MLPTSDRRFAAAEPHSVPAAALLRSGELGRRLVNLANLAAAAHMARAAERIVREREGAAVGERSGGRA